MPQKKGTLNMQARDEMLVTKGTFLQFLKNDDSVVVINESVEKARTTLIRIRTTEFENWALRIVHGAGKTRAKSVSKAMTAKHKMFVSCDGDPARDAHKAVWAAAKPFVGEGNDGSPAAEQVLVVSASSAASSSSTAAAAKAGKVVAKRK